MSNYRSHYCQTRPDRLTPRQWRRYDRKYWRDQRNNQIEGFRSGNPTRPAGLSGYPGRRRKQLDELQALAADRAAARALRKLAGA